MIPDAPPVLAPGYHAVPDGHLAAVVTALEMRERPALPSLAARDDVVLRRMERPSTDWYRRIFRRVGEPWLWTSRLLLDDAALGAILGDPGVEVSALGAPDEPEDAAFGLLELDFRTRGACEIAFFGLEIGRTGRGLGRYMMTKALARAWSQPGVERVWVHTCTLDDPSAVRFYRAMGFTPYARQVEILPDPRLSGVLSRSAQPATPALGV